MLQNERGAGSRQGRVGKVDSRQSNNRRHNSSRQAFGKQHGSMDSGLGIQSTDGTYDNMFGGGMGQFDPRLFDQFAMQ